jgi:hypothetical protein
MNKITFPLKDGNRGAAVVDLQDALLLLLERRFLLDNVPRLRDQLSAALRTEREEQVYKDITHNLIGLFQETQQLQPASRGEVDEATANAINAVLRQLGVLSEPPRERAMIVSGQLRLAGGSALKGSRVCAFHESEGGAIRLGEDSSDAEGRYTIRYELLPGVAGVNLRIETYDDQGAVLQSSEVIREAKPIEVVNLLVPVALRPAGQRRVEGRIVFDNGLPAENLMLRLYRLDFGGLKIQLGEDKPTRELGVYDLPFDLGGKPAGLQVYALNEAGEETPLCKPLYDFGDEARVIVNLIAPANLKTQAAEYTRLLDDLTPHLGELNLAEASERSDRQDLTVLNRATGWDARLIALAAHAEKLSADEEVQLPREAIYGMLRAGLPSDKLQLAQVKPEVVEQALKSLRDAAIVGLQEEQLTEVRAQFETFANKTRLAVTAPGSRSTYGDLLRSSGLNEEAQKQFAEAYLSDSRDADLWTKARDSGLNDRQIETLQRQGKLAYLTDNNETLTARLMEKPLNELSQLVDMDFHRAEQWEAEIKRAAGINPDGEPEVGGINPDGELGALAEADEEKLKALIPPTYASAKVGDGLKAYAADLARKVRLSYPTQVVGRLVEQDASGSFKLGESRAATALLLKKAAAENFKLGQTSVETFFKSNPQVVNGIANADAAQENIKTLHRVYQITPSDEAMPVLMKMGLTSAFDIAGLSEEVFAERYSKAYFELYGGKPAVPAEPNLVYRKAQQINSVTYNLFTIAKKLAGEATVSVISGSAQQHSDAMDNLKVALKDYPTMESLFGSMDYCECEHCRSVLSPAAYLVDLLQFLDPEPEVWNNALAQWKDAHKQQDYTAKYKQPYMELIQRRPDIPQISLNCENTNTALPYIDVVNEILEYYVAHQQLSEEAARDTGEATTAELLTEPQNVIAGAYDKLQQARYPLHLPFDLWLETVRQFCDYFETPLEQLLETFRAGEALFASSQSYDRAAIFLESIGLSPAEQAIFFDVEPLKDDKWYELYGYSTAKARIGDSVNIENATLTIPDAEAAHFSPGDLCTYFDVDADALHKQSKAIKAIGVAGSGGADQTTIEFTGIWAKAPEAGDLLVFDAAAVLKSAKALSRRLGVTYKEIVEIVESGFVNPQLANLGILYKLGVTISDARFYTEHKAAYEENKNLLEKDRSSLSAADQMLWDEFQKVQAFEERLTRLSQEFKVPLARLEDELQEIPFEEILVLADPDAGCNFDLTTLRYADRPEHAADAIVFLKINLFVRLWRKLGWTIEETDRALQTFVPKSTPFATAHLDKQPLKTALIYLAHFKKLDEQLHIGKHSRLKLLTLWSDLSVNGKRSLYTQLFLTPGMLKSDAVFDDALGQYLSPIGIAAMADSRRHEVSLAGVAPADQIDPLAFEDEPKISVVYDRLLEVQHLAFEGVLNDIDKDMLSALSPSPALPPLLDAVQEKALEFTLVKGHMSALQGGLGLTEEEIARILKDAGKELATTKLSLNTLSLLYRYGLLARALKLSVRDFITLKELADADPFKPLHNAPLTRLDDDYPFSQTLRFVEVAEQVRESGLHLEDLDYLLRHRFDETGKYRQNSDATLALLRTLAEGIRAIRTEQAVPADPGAMSEESLRQKLGMVMPAEVVDRLLAMLNGTAEFTATRLLVAGEVPLNPEDFTEVLAVRQVKYNETRRQQKLTFRGALSDAEKNSLKGRIPKPVPPNLFTPSPVLGDLLEDVQTQARSFFRQHLEKQAPATQPSPGFLDPADFALLFAPMPTGGNQTEQQERLREEGLRAARARLTQTFLPYLQQRLIRQFIIQTLAAQLSAAPALLEALLSDPRLLGNSLPLQESFDALGERGVSATFFDGAGAKLATRFFADADTGLKDKAQQPLKPANANSARMQVYFEVPLPGAYRFTIEATGQNAEADLHFKHLPKVFLSTSTGQISDYVELKPGVPYPFTFDVKKLSGGDVRVLVQAESLPKGSLTRLTLYPQTAIEGAEQTLLLLSKVLQLIQSLNLSEREVLYLFTNPADFDNLDFSKLPTTGSAIGDTAALKQAQELFKQSLRLFAYARLKASLAAGTDDLIGIFESDALDKVYGLLARLTRREEATIKAVAKLLFATPRFKNELPVQRLWQGLQVVERFGVAVASLLDWTRIVGGDVTSAQSFAIARDLKAAIKARFEPEAWQRVAQPIFDRLRQRQRDALVAQVMHQQGFARMEQLYEYFLIDPGMEPVVQTSRIRLAISSVQLFIQRCLINLESAVPPSVINAKQWEWMKRYRVWEANRKIFLFPENYLEPEFRDDKTHLFSELEGNLLQGDVSSDLVEDAFLNYLKKLEELARLDVVAMHLEDNIEPAHRVLHVIGRTYSQPHKYFYRRYAHRVWTPWEPVTAEIEGDHLAPVVWRGRLYLFWVTFLEKAEQPVTASSLKAQAVLTPKGTLGAEVFAENIDKGPKISAGSQPPKVELNPPKAPEPEKNLTQLTLTQVMGGAAATGGKQTIEAHLHWSEYLQGQWSTCASGGLSGPSPVASSGVYNFDRKGVFIHVSKEPYGENGEERGVYIHLGGAIQQAFYMAGRNSAPEMATYGKHGPIPANPYSPTSVQATRYAGAGGLRVTFKPRSISEDGKPSGGPPKTSDIFGQSLPFTLLPCDNEIQLAVPELAPLMRPLFYQDRTYTLFAEPNVEERTIEEWKEWVTRTPQPAPAPSSPGLGKEYVKPMVPRARLQTPIDPGDPIWRLPVARESLATMQSGEDWLVNPSTALRFEGEVIGAGGRVGLAVVSSAAAAAALAEGGVPVNVHAGSDLAQGSLLVARTNDNLNQSSLAQATGMMNIVGSSGLNPALAQNFEALRQPGTGIARVGGKLIEP